MTKKIIDIRLFVKKIFYRFPYKENFRNGFTFKCNDSSPVKDRVLFLSQEIYVNSRD